MENVGREFSEPEGCNAPSSCEIVFFMLTSHTLFLLTCSDDRLICFVISKYIMMT